MKRISKTKIILALLLLILAHALPVLYYLWATKVADIAWNSWAGRNFFIYFLGPLACFFAVSTFVYWWEMLASKPLKYHIFPILCMALSTIPVILYIYIWIWK